MIRPPGTSARKHLPEQIDVFLGAVLVDDGGKQRQVVSAGQLISVKIPRHETDPVEHSRLGQALAGYRDDGGPVEKRCLHFRSGLQKSDGVGPGGAAHVDQVPCRAGLDSRHDFLRQGCSHHVHGPDEGVQFVGVPGSDAGGSDEPAPLTMGVRLDQLSHR